MKKEAIVVRRLLPAASAAILMLSLSVGAVAAGGGNPAGTGQPGAECGDEGAELEPAGFLTKGFANAELHYAGSDGTHSLANANSEHAVSQYDIACVHYTASH
jgi:hypothetical protein